MLILTCARWRSYLNVAREQAHLVRVRVRVSVRVRVGVRVGVRVRITVRVSMTWNMTRKETSRCRLAMRPS